MSLKQTRNFPYKRSDRISGEIQKDISDMVARGLLKDPRIGFVNISSVEVSDDLKTVKVYFTKLGSNLPIENILKGFKSANNYIRSTISRNLRLKYIPEFFYFYDTSFDYADKIEKLLKDVKKHNE